MADQHQVGPAIAHLVGHIVGAGGKRHQVQAAAAEGGADAVLELRPGLPRVHPCLGPADDLVQVGLGQKAQRGPGPVVQVGRVLDELLSRVVDEAHLQVRGQHGVAQLLGGGALQLLVEGEGVPQDGAGHEGGVGRQAGVVLGVELLGQGVAGLGGRGHVVADGRVEGGQLQPRHHFVAHLVVARVQVVQVDGVGAPGLLLPQVPHGPGHQPQHPPHPLEVGQGGQLVGQRAHQRGVQGVAGPQLGLPVLVGALRREVPGVGRPQAAVGRHHLGGPGVVNAGEQPAAQHLGCLLLRGGVQHGGFAGRHALGLVHLPRHELVFRGVGVQPEAPLSDGQGEHQGRARAALHRLEQRGEEGGELLRLRPALDLAQVDGQLVQQDQGRLAAEKVPDVSGTRRPPLLVAGPHRLVPGDAGQGVGQLAPWGVSSQPMIQ